MDEESQPLLNAEWISAAEAFVWLAFRGSRPGWRVSKALADYQSDYGVSWLTLSDAIANGDITHNEVRARMVKLRERRLPHEANEQRERMIDDLIRDLPKRAQEIRDGGEAIAAARNYFVAQALCGKLGVYFSNNTSAPTEEFQRAASSTFVQGMTIHTEGSIEPRDDLARQDRLDLHNRMKKRDIASVWFKTKQVLKLRLPAQTKNDRPSSTDVIDWMTRYYQSERDCGRPPPKQREEAFIQCHNAINATDRQMRFAIQQVPRDLRRGRGQPPANRAD
jgi:hypothetical protein